MIASSIIESLTTQPRQTQRAAATTPSENESANHQPAQKFADSLRTASKASSSASSAPHTATSATPKPAHRKSSAKDEHTPPAVPGVPSANSAEALASPSLQAVLPVSVVSSTLLSLATPVASADAAAAAAKMPGVTPLHTPSQPSATTAAGIRAGVVTDSEILPSVSNPLQAGATLPRAETAAKAVAEPGIVLASTVANAASNTSFKGEMDRLRESKGLATPPDQGPAGAVPTAPGANATADQVAQLALPRLELTLPGLAPGLAGSTEMPGVQRLNGASPSQSKLSAAGASSAKNNPVAGSPNLGAGSPTFRAGSKDSTGLADHGKDASLTVGAQVAPTSGGQGGSNGSSQGENPSTVPTNPAATAANAHVQNPASSIAPAPASVASSDMRHVAAPLADTPAVLHAAPETLPVINTAKLIQSMGQSEMRVGMHSAEFGNISIRTTTTRDLISAQISLDHGDLGKVLTAHLPEINGVNVRIDMSGQNLSGGMSGSMAGGSHANNQGANNQGANNQGANNQGADNRGTEYSSTRIASHDVAGSNVHERLRGATALTTAADGRLNARLDIRV